MDIDDKPMGSSSPARKVPLEELSKEELLKKYKGAIALAQKAKLAKDEASEETSKKNTLIISLEDKLRASEHDLQSEIHHSKKIQEQLQATQELLASQQKLQCETETLVEERVAALTASVKAENAELLKELNVMNQVLKQRGELISKMTASHTDYTRQIDELEVSMSNCNKELLLKTAELENMADFTRQLTELKSTLLAMSKDLSDRDDKIEKLTMSLKELDATKGELKVTVALVDEMKKKGEEEKCQYVKDLDERDGHLSKLQKKIEHYENHLKETSLNYEEKLETLIVELNLKNRQLEDLTSQQEKFRILQENSVAENNKAVISLREEISNLQSQLEDNEGRFTQKETENFEMQASLLQNQLESSSFKCLELMEELKSRDALVGNLEMELKGTNENLNQEIKKNQILNDKIAKLEDELISLKELFQQDNKILSDLKTSCSDKEKTIQDLLASKDDLSMANASKLLVSMEKIKELEEETSSLVQTLAMKEKEILSLKESLKEKSESLLEWKTAMEKSDGTNETILADIKQQLEASEENVKEKDLKISNLETSITSLYSQLDEAQKNINDKTNAIISCQEEIDRLRAQVHEKDEVIKAKDLHITTLCDDYKKIQEELILLQSVLTETKASSVDELNHHKGMVSELTAKVDDLQSKLSQQLNEISKLKSEKQALTDKEIHLLASMKELEVQRNTIQTKFDVKATSESELENQLSILQDKLHSKETSIFSLEQEISKLKEVASHDTTNTEVSSTYSMSQAEEQARLRDLEDSFEDKYTKLRVVAVKLKKRVSELTQILESERNKMSSEKSELQAKLSQLANHAKTTQTLQSEVDRLQDMLEEQKKYQQQLSKELDNTAQDASAAKTRLAELQEKFDEIVQEKNSLQSSKAKLETALAHAEALSSETERLCKELREKEVQLEQSNEEVKKLSDQLDKACVDAKKRSVLTLEMEDMEKSVIELTQQLNSEKALSKNKSNELDEERVLVSNLREQLSRMEDIINDKELSVTILEEKLSTSKVEVEEYKTKYIALETSTKQLQAQSEAQQSIIEGLNLQLSDLAAKQVQISENARQQIETLGRQVFQLEEKCSALMDSNSVTEAELAAVRTEFEGYKVRAQSVLRQSTRQEERLVASRNVHDAEELELEVERLRVTLNNLKINHQKTMSQLEAALHDANVEREEKANSLKLCQSLRENCALVMERQHAAEDKLAAALEEAKQSKLHTDMLIQCYKQQIEDLKTTHHKKVTSLNDQLETLQTSINNNPSNSELDRTSSVQSGPSPVAEWASNAAILVPTDPDSAIRMSTLTREEGEGSESIDSFPSRRISVTTQERRHELVPLDKLLSSSSYPGDESSMGTELLASSTQLNIDTLQAKLNACESRASHLTALLSEAESDAARHSQLNAVLKEEIRRLQRSEERTQHAHNLEYLKNIVVKFITLQNGDERLRLIPVLNTILKLSPDEAGMIESVAKGNPSTTSSGRGWGSYLPIPGWSGS